jgi:hypothetical protein
MADFEFQIKREGTVYDWPQVIGQAPGLYNEEEGLAANKRFQELPFEKKKQLYDAWVPEMRTALEDTGAEDLTPFDNYVVNELGFLEEAYNPQEDTPGQDIAGGIGEAFQGVGDRLNFLGSPEILSRVSGMASPLGPLSMLVPAGANRSAIQPGAPVIQGASTLLQSEAARAGNFGQAIQEASGAKPETQIFQPGRLKWWIEKGVPTLGGLLTDLGLAAATGPAAPLTFAASAASQVGGDVLQESRGQYQAQAREKYDANLKAGMAVAEARTQLRGELKEAEDKASTEAALVGMASAIINTVPGSSMTQPMRRKLQDAIVKKGLVNTLRKVGPAALKEGMAEVFDEVAQDAGRSSRVDTWAARWEQYRKSNPVARYAAAGTLGSVLGAGVDVGMGIRELARNKTQDLQERIPASPEPSPSPEASTASEATETPTGGSESVVELSSELDVTPEGDAETETISETPIPIEKVAPIRYKKDVIKGNEISWITPLGQVESGIVQSRDKDTIKFEDGRTKEFRGDQIFSGRVTPKPNTANMEFGDVLSTGDALYRYAGNGEFHTGARIQGEISFDSADPVVLGRNIIDDPRTTLYAKDSFNTARESYNSRPDPKNSDTFGPYLNEIGAKPYDQGRAVQSSPEGEANPATGAPGEVPQGSGQEASQEQVQEAVASGVVSNTQPEAESLNQLRTELIRRARLDKGKDLRIQQAQVENLVQVIDASAQAIASRTGRSKVEILGRVSFSHDKPAGQRTPAAMAGEYTAIDRIIRLYPKTNATTVVHEWMHFVLEEHIYNLDEGMNILNREERKVLEEYARQKAPKAQKGEDAGLLRSGGRPSKRYHEFMADLMEHMFHSRYQDGNKPSGMPDRIFDLLKKVGDFIRQVYSKIRYNWQQSEFDGSQKEQEVLALMDRIFIPEQIQDLVANATPPTDVILPTPNLNEAPNVNRMYADLQASRESQTKNRVADNTYRTIDRLEADGRLGQTPNQEAPRSGLRTRQPSLAAREIDLYLEDGISDFVNLMQASTYEQRSRELTKSAAREFLAKMSTGEAIATIMGDPYAASASIQGQLRPEVYVAAAMILARRLRSALGGMQDLVRQGKISGNQALEISGVYERYLKYFVETIAPGAGRSVDILNEYRKPVSTQNRIERLLGVLGAANSQYIKRGLEKLGPERVAWIRAYAVRNREGSVNPETYARRGREFKAEFVKSFPPEQQALARSVANDALRLFQTIQDNPDVAIPGAAVQAFGQNYWFRPETWEQIEQIMPVLDGLPDDSIVRDWVHGEITALLATEAGIPLGQLISSHFMAQYLCAPSTALLSLFGNGSFMVGRLAALITGFSNNPNGRFGINPNLAYLPQMFDSLVQSYAFGRGNLNRGVTWKNMRQALLGMGGGTRVHQGRISPTEIYRSALRYTTPEGLIGNLGHVFNRFYSLMQTSPYRLLSVADAAVGTGTRGLTSTVAASQVAHWNAERYGNQLAANPALIPAGQTLEQAVRNLRNADYTRLMGRQPVQMQAALQTATDQVNAVLANPTIARGRLGDQGRRGVMLWAAYNQELDRIRAAEFASQENVPEPDATQVELEVRQDAEANGEVITEEQVTERTDAEVQARIDEASQAVATNYEQELELDRAFSSFSYRPRGTIGRVVQSMEGFIAATGLNLGRIGGRHRMTEEGTLAVEGGVNVGDIHPLRFLLPFLNAAALGVVGTIQSTPFGLIASARRAGAGAPAGDWNQAERNTFNMMAFMGSVVFLIALRNAWDDEDPLEEEKEHVIGPIPNTDWGRRLKARGIEPYTQYKLNNDGSVSKMKLNTIQGPFISPLLMVGSFNSIRWDATNREIEQSLPEAAFQASIMMGKTLGVMGPLGQLARYGTELDDRKFNQPYSQVANGVKNLGMDSILWYRRGFNEVGALMNNAGIAAGMNWEPDTKNVPATVQGETAQNALKTLTNDYLINAGQSRAMLNGFGEEIKEDPNPFRKVGTITASTPMNDALAEHGLTLAPMSQYKVGIRKGSSDEMKELFAEVGRKRSETLPRHLIGDLRDDELYDYMKGFYGPLLQKTVGEFLKGDPYSKPEIQDLITEALANPGSNRATEAQVKKQVVQAYIDKLRSQVELTSQAQYFAAKNPELDSDFVADYISDLVEAAQEGEDFR